MELRERTPDAARAHRVELGAAAHRRSDVGARVLFDLVLVVVATTLAETAFASRELAIAWLAVFVVLTIAGLAAFGAYRPSFAVGVSDGLRAAGAATALAAMAVLVAATLVGTGVANGEIARLWVFVTVYVAAARAGFVIAEQRRRRAGGGTPTIIIGAGRVARLTAARLLANPELGLRPIGYLDKEPAAVDDDPDGLPVLGASWDLDDVIDRHGVGHVLVTFSTAPHHVLLGLVARAAERGIAVSLVPRLFERMPTRLSVTHVGGLPLIRLHHADPRGISFAAKYVIDRVLALVLLVLILPVLVAISVSVWLSVGRPILFRQVRVGRDDRSFEMLKFRTMRDVPAEKRLRLALPPDVAPGGVEGIDRQTRVGRFLRETSLDELPQILNVLRGDMSIVGPRPERPEYVDQFVHSVHRYSERHRVKAGITGWAQVHDLRGNTSLAERVEWDNYYIENWSLWLDLKIILKTIPKMVPLR